VIISSTDIELNGKKSKTNLIRIVIGDEKNGNNINNSGQGASIIGANGLFPDTAFG
jgi:hypothetical protein